LFGPAPNGDGRLKEGIAGRGVAGAEEGAARSIATTVASKKEPA
jgi:hypothetical protein